MMTGFSQDTIAAIASGRSTSGIGIVRVSGVDAIEIVNKIFTGADLSSAPTHTVHYGWIKDGEELIDEVLLLLMRSPRTYTKEDCIEIDCHGGPFLMQRVLETVLSAGCRLADPGEFTKRAFLNGRIDLTEAESVISLISSKNEYARKSALFVLRGSMRKEIEELRRRILKETAFIEAALDDPEHYDLTGFSEELKGETESLIREIDELLSRSENGRLLSEGIKTVILGKPNVGKSSLLNLLLGEERAIVTEIAGTTRDLVEEQMNLNGILLNIIDTAGIRKTSDQVERIGVDRARKAAENADLILFLIDASKPLHEEDREIAALLSGKQSIVLLNKSDLNTEVTEQEVMDLLSDPDTPLISISAKEGNGLDELQKTITDVFFKGNISFNDEIVVTNLRQKEALRKTRESLKLVINSIDKGMPEDFFSIDLMDAYGELGRMIGVEVGEDLVDKIFSDFCMGK